MQIIVGLGNPGLKYRKTRHNIGFRILDGFREENNLPKFRLNKKLKAEISKGIIGDKEVLLAKPQTFMNSSGLSVKSLIGNCIVVHDDFDLPLGETKITEKSGSGGHHGVQSIIDSLKTQNFIRVKVGIRPDNQLSIINNNLKAEDFVLKKFTKQEESTVAQAIKKSCQQITSLLASH